MIGDDDSTCRVSRQSKLLESLAPLERSVANRRIRSHTYLKMYVKLASVFGLAQN